MKRLWKYRKTITFTEYCPESQLILPETAVERASVPVLDAHVHVGCRKKGGPFEEYYDAEEEMEKLRELGVCHCVDLTLFDRENWERVQKKTAGIREFIDYCAPIDLSGFSRPGYFRWQEEEMERYAAEGAVGFKIWKELGMSVRDAGGQLVELDSPCLDPIWEKAAALQKPLVMHVADPPAFFEKADARNERLEEIRNHHYWHHYGRDYTFRGLLEQLDRLLTRRPRNRFLIAHCCSWPSNLGFLEDMLERHGNLWTDISASLSELGRQPRRFRRLLEVYPERLLFGTDYFFGTELPHRPYFRFLETEDEYFPYSEAGSLEHGRWNIYGCGLPPELLRKLYYENAVSFFDLKV